MTLLPGVPILQDSGTDDEAAIGPHGRVEVPVRIALGPGTPTTHERIDSYAKQLPCCSWCPVCVKASGSGDDYTNQAYDDETNEADVSFDYISSLPTIS